MKAHGTTTRRRAASSYASTVVAPWPSTLPKVALSEFMATRDDTDQLSYLEALEAFRAAQKDAAAED
jgi:hypothetical protein